MKFPKQYLTSCFLNFIFPPILGVVCFAIWSAVVRSDQTWVNRIGGAFVLVPLCLPFAFLIFGLPGLLYTAIVSGISTIKSIYRTQVTLATALILGGTLFPLWIMSYKNPMDDWGLLFCVIGSICFGISAYLTLRILKNSNKSVDSTP